MGLDDEVFVTAAGQYKTSTINKLMVDKVLPSRSNDVSDTTIMLFEDLRICIEDFMDSFGNRSNRFILRVLIEHGYSLMQEDHAKNIKMMRGMRRTYRRSDITLLRAASMDFKLETMENQGKGDKRHFQMSINFLGAIKDASTVLMTSVANIERAAICYSLATFDYNGKFFETLPGRTFDFAVKEREAFKDSCFQVYALYETFPYIEESYKRIKKNGGIMDDANLYR
jgi:hypothetical protein